MTTIHTVYLERLGEEHLTEAIKAIAEAPIHVPERDPERKLMFIVNRLCAHFSYLDTLEDRKLLRDDLVKLARFFHQHPDVDPYHEAYHYIRFAAKAALPESEEVQNAIQTALVDADARVYSKSYAERMRWAWVAGTLKTKFFFDDAAVERAFAHWNLERERKNSTVH